MSVLRAWFARVRAASLLFWSPCFRAGGRSQGGREISRRDRGRDLLIAAQVALASILLLATSLLLHSFVRLRAVDPGFDPERISTLSVYRSNGEDCSTAGTKTVRSKW